MNGLLLDGGMFQGKDLNSSGLLIQPHFGRFFHSDTINFDVLNDKQRDFLSSFEEILSLKFEVK